MPYVTYLRKSRKDLDLERQGGEDTLSRHRRELASLADRLHLQVDAVYEEVVSGDSIAVRPRMQQLLQEVQDGLWEGVLVMEIERLARGDTMDQGLVANAFKYSGTKIVTPVKTYDPLSEIDEEYFEFSLFMSRREYKTINRRLREGKRSAMREGKFTGAFPPFGYDKVKLNGQKGRSLTPNADADLVREMFRLFLQEDYSLYRLSCWLNSQGKLNSRGNRWTEQTVKTMMKNHHYAGLTTNVRRPTKKVVRSGAVKITRPVNPEPVYYKALHEPLVSEEDFWAAQRKLQQQTKSRAPHVYGFRNPLNGLVVCDQCGRVMHRHHTNDRNREHLKCPNPNCKTVMHDLPEVEHMILQALRDWHFNMTAKEASAQSAAPQLEALEKKHTRLQAAAAALEQRERRTYELLEECVYTPAEFSKRRAQIAKESAEVAAELQSTAAEIAAARDLIRRQADLVPRVDHVLQIYEDTQDPESRNMLVKSILQKVVYHKTIRGTKKNHMTDLCIDIYPITYV